MPTYRAAVIGCGGRSRPHIQAYAHIDDAEVVACCAPTPTRRGPLAAEFGIRAYADPREMIEKERPHLVHLVTWPDTRVELMTLMAELDVPLCTVEKPIAVAVADWKALRTLEQDSATRFAVCHQFRWQPHIVKCRQALASGALGDLKFLDISAGMNISGQGTHILNYGMSLNQDLPVTRVFGAASGTQGMTGGHPAPDSTVGYLTFANNLRALWNNGPTTPTCGDPTTEWQHVRIAAHADRGRVNFEEFGKWEIVSPEGTESGDFGDMETWMANNLRAQAAFHQAMFTWLEDETQIPGTNLAQSLHEWQVVLALYTSAVQRKSIEIADFDPQEDIFQQLEAALTG